MGKIREEMPPRTIQATISLPVEELSKLICANYTDRHAAMVQKYGEACTKSQASKIVGCSAPTISAMLADGRILAACGGTRVDVRSLAEYIENRGEMNCAARMARRGHKKYV